jgi:hypothetical protein
VQKKRLASSGDKQERASNMWQLNSDRDRGREDGAFIESEPVGVMVIRHGLLNYPNPLQPFISLDQSKMYRCQGINGVKGTNMGLIKTIGEGAERPGISSDQIPTILSLLELH